MNVLMGFVVRDWSRGVVEFTYYGGGHHRGIDNYRPSNYLLILPKLAEKGLYVSG